LSKFIIFIFGIFLISGCASGGKLDKLLTLKGLSEEQAQMGEYVDAQDKKFEFMLKEQKDGKLDQYLSKDKIVRTFGEPVYVNHVRENDQKLEIWLYRNATQFFGSQKIYIYFDSDENFVRSEYLDTGKKIEDEIEQEEKNGKIREETTQKD